METFPIHQESEKENASHAFPEKSKNVQSAKYKRITFKVLNSVPQSVRAVPEKTAFRNVKINKGKNTSETSGNVKIQQQKKVLATVPVEQFKSLTVHENISSGNSKDRKDADKQKDSVACAIKDPLRNISSSRDIFLETPMSVDDVISPMSVSEIISPMSIDKPSDDDENKQSAISPCPPSNDRKCFFEVEEYQQDIFEYLKEIEEKFRPIATYMTRQPDINYSMRAIVVDWLVEVAKEYSLHNETLYLAVSSIDRFLSVTCVGRSKFQLVGTVVMFIAAKYEEIYPPDVDDFIFATDDTYTKAEVIKMEQIILRALHFQLCVPTKVVFINTYAVLYEMPDQIKFLATYIAELSLLLGEPYLQFLPSQTSSAALALARYILDFPIWCPELEKITTYSLQSLKIVILHLCQMHNLSLTLAQQAIPEKYKASKYMEVSTIKPIQLNEEKLEKIVNAYNKSVQTS